MQGEGFLTVASGDRDKDGNRGEALKDLDRRLNQATSRRREEEEGRSVGPGKQAARIGMDLVAGAIMGVVLGLALDQVLGTSPFGLIVLLFIGFAAGVRNSFREAQKMAREQEDSQPAKRSPNASGQGDRPNE